MNDDNTRAYDLLKEAMPYLKEYYLANQFAGGHLIMGDPDKVKNLATNIQNLLEEKGLR